MAPSWYPSFFITDYSDAEMSAITKLFPNTQLYLCDFHREQAWERWVKDRKHGLTDTQSSELLDLLRDCANSPVNTSVEKEPTDYFFKQACDRLQMSDVWKRNEQVRKWISTTWFSCSKFWARCFRDQTYHAAVNTTNGVESQNKLLKYSYLPKRRNITISSLATILYEDFNHDIHHKYLFLNSKTQASYRAYKPSYLHGRPRHVIIHCLDRKSSSRKYDDTDVTCQDATIGVFNVTGSSKLHTVNFGISSSDQPSCTCLDWIRWKLPCKHFFAVFKFYREWGLERLPAEFTSQPHISCVATFTSQQNLGAQYSSDLGIDHEIVPNALVELPTKQVCVFMIN